MPVVLIVASSAEGPEADLARALRERGLEAVLARSVAEAETCLRRAEPDVIVVRHPLPDSEAVTWIESLRAAGCRRPVVREPVVPALVADQVASLVAGAARDTGSVPAGFAEEMAALRAEYALALPGSLDELARAARLARERPDDLDRARELKRLAHALHGSAGTFGFPGVSEAAGQIEDAAGRHIQEPGAGSAGALLAVEELLAAARAGLAREG